MYTFRTVDYVKWQLLINELAMSIGSLDLSWGILRKMKFPKTAKLAEASSMACVELVEIAMPLAIARPFVEDFIIENITDIVRAKLYSMYNYKPCLCACAVTGG